MTKINNAMAAVTLFAIAGVSTAAAAHADSTACTRWDESDSMRCFNCEQRVWTGHDWTIVNVCPRRSTVPPYAWGYGYVR